MVASFGPKKANREVMGGDLRELKGSLVIDNNGGQYSVASKQALPPDF